MILEFAGDEYDGEEYPACRYISEKNICKPHAYRSKKNNMIFLNA